MYLIIFELKDCNKITNKANEALEIFIHSESQHTKSCRILTDSKNCLDELLSEFESNFRYYRMMGVSIGVPDVKMLNYLKVSREKREVSEHQEGEYFEVLPF